MFPVKSICAILSALEGKFESSSIVHGKSCSIIVLNIQCEAFKAWKDMMAVKSVMIYNIY